MAEGVIEVAPLAYMRGRTLSESFIILDEAQNCTYTQLKMLLTRLGFNSSMIITGDPKQSDISNSGLNTVAEKLQDLSGISIVDLDASDIVRHELVASMLERL